MSERKRIRRSGDRVHIAFLCKGRKTGLFLWQIAGVRRVCRIHVIFGCLFNLMKKEYLLLNGLIGGKFINFVYITVSVLNLVFKYPFFDINLDVILVSIKYLCK